MPTDPNPSYYWLYSQYTQTFPPRPTLHSGNLPSQAGRVFIVTGGSSGIGYYLSKYLYQAGGTVYIFSRGHTDASTAIDSIKSAPLEQPNPNWGSPGKLKYIHIDFSDLRTVKPAAEEFIKAEKRLDVLFNNAGVGSLPHTQVTAQGTEPLVGINCLGAHLLTKLLLPLLTQTSKDPSTPRLSTRVIFTSSLLVEATSPKGGVILEHLDNPTSSIVENYSASKAGNWFLASEYQSHYPYSSSGILFLTQNPGSLVTNVWRTTPWYQYYPFAWMLGKAEDGACTELWAGMSDDVREGDGGRYAIPFGRWAGYLRPDLVKALKSEGEGGTGQAGKFWEWCEKKVKEFQ